MYFVFHQLHAEGIHLYSKRTNRGNLAIPGHMIHLYGTCMNDSLSILDNGPFLIAIEGFLSFLALRISEDFVSLK